VGFHEQVQLIRDACGRFEVDIGFVEDNGFQVWLLAEVRRDPRMSGVIFGHSTGREKRSLEQGIPSLKIDLTTGLWNGSLPTGDHESAAYAAVFRTEAAAFTWKDGKLMGIGEHDDTVMSLWLADLAARLQLERLGQNLEPEIVTMEDLGIEPVKIGPDY
jgi:hypothetical protein